MALGCIACNADAGSPTVWLWAAQCCTKRQYAPGLEHTERTFSLVKRYCEMKYTGNYKYKSNTTRAYIHLLTLTLR